MQSYCYSYVLKTIEDNRNYFVLLALSEAGQYVSDLPQVGPQLLNRLPTYVMLISELLLTLSFSSLPEDDIRSKYMTVPIKAPDVKPEELYKLPKRPKKSSDVLEEVKR
jgi:hypothetical protein